ncbi:MAG: CvpA family protein [Sedimentisphaerales bacterium]|nr:CvpA family protein [Sedimentisphaerales bacterium]
MVFWIGILVGGLFVWMAVKRGFYDTWTMLFNIVISVYTALYLTPLLVEVLPGAGETAYGNALTLVAVAVAVFFILCITSLTLFTGRFKVSFPKLLDNLGAGVLGFLAGLLVWSFAVLLISATPVGQTAFAGSIGLGDKIKQTNSPYLCSWCNLVNTVAASADTRRPAQDVVTWLLDQAKDKTPKQPDPNEPPN